MAGLRVIVSLGGFLFILLTSFSAASKERSARAGWTQVDSDKQGDYKFLALLEYSAPERAPAYCSGTITSPETVLTFCAGKPTKAYAGSLTIEKNARNGGDIQERNVGVVKDLTGLKICSVTENWQFKDNVGSVELDLEGGSVSGVCKVVGFKKDDSKYVAQLIDQEVGDGTKCRIDPSASGILYSKVETGQELGGSYLGGPVLCGGKQRGISKEYKAGETGPPETDACNLYIDVAHHSTWIEDNTPDDSGENQEPNGTGTGTGNGTGASAGSSIHAYMKKKSESKVLGLLLLSLVVSVLL